MRLLAVYRKELLFMNNTVILAEKPSQAQAYAESFDTQQRKDGYYIVSGNGFNEAIITYGFGHLVSLFNPEEYQEEKNTQKRDRGRGR